MKRYAIFFRETVIQRRHLIIEGEANVHAPIAAARLAYGNTRRGVSWLRIGNERRRDFRRRRGQARPLMGTRRCRWHGGRADRG